MIFSKKYISAMFIILLTILTVMCLTACSRKNTDKKQESDSDKSVTEKDSATESESESEKKTEIKTNTNSERATVLTRKVQGMITEIYTPTDDAPYYLFKIEGNNYWYKFLINDNSTVLDILLKVSVESSKTDADGNRLVEKLDILGSIKEENTEQYEKASGIIIEILNFPTKDSPYYVFKLEGDDKEYSFFTKNSSIILNVGDNISIEYKESTLSSNTYYNVKTIEKNQ